MEGKPQKEITKLKKSIDFHNSQSLVDALTTNKYGITDHKKIELAHELTLGIKLDGSKSDCSDIVIPNKEELLLSFCSKFAISDFKSFFLLDGSKLEQK